MLLEHSFWSREQDVDRGVGYLVWALVLSLIRFGGVPLGSVITSSCRTHQGSYCAAECSRRV
jgi:hypothetical protein